MRREVLARSEFYQRVLGGEAVEQYMLTSEYDGWCLAGDVGTGFVVIRQFRGSGGGVTLLPFALNDVFVFMERCRRRAYAYVRYSRRRR